ncbi:MAG: GTP cyclohydrolase I, partial [Chloroflexota bacterium]
MTNIHHNDLSSATDLELLEDRLHAPQFLERFESDYPPVDHPRIESAIRDVLIGVGEDVEREGLIDTPRRVARAYDELLSGYRTDPAALLNNALFDVD